MTTYKIIRFFRDDNKKKRVIKRGLTKDEAQYHCGLESTHKLESNGDVVWFDGWSEDD